VYFRNEVLVPPKRRPRLAREIVIVVFPGT
jgi:hypothetical protein